MTGSIEPIVGRYVRLDIGGADHRLFSRKRVRAARLCCSTRPARTRVNGALAE